MLQELGAGKFLRELSPDKDLRKLDYNQLLKETFSTGLSHLISQIDYVIAARDAGGVIRSSLISFKIKARHQ